MNADTSFLFSSPGNICRICLLEPKGHPLNIFDEIEESRDIISKILACFHIKLSFDKNLPHYICNNCIEELNIANNFRLKCITFAEKYDLYCKKNIITTEHSHSDPVNCIKKNKISENVQCNTVEDNYDHDMMLDETNYFKTERVETHGQMLSDIPQVTQALSYFKCSICNKVLRSKLSLAKHNVCMHEKRKHVGKVTGCGASRRYHCRKCPYSTPHSQTLVNHMHRHDGVRPYQCECGKSFTQTSSLAAHRKTHSHATFYTCSVCGKQFKHAFSLKKHLLVHETGNFNCNMCQKTLKTKKSLQDHMHRHYNIRNFNCEDCGDTFVTSSELQSHRLKHSIDKKVECHLCGYKTNTKKSLIVHLKRHVGNKTFKCSSCERAFYTAGDLRRHQRVHSREKPYPCPACAQRFTHSSSLNKHMLNVHGIHYKWADINTRDTTKIKPNK